MIVIFPVRFSAPVRYCVHATRYAFYIVHNRCSYEIIDIIINSPIVEFKYENINYDLSLVNFFFSIFHAQSDTGYIDLHKTLFENIRLLSISSTYKKTVKGRREITHNVIFFSSSNSTR